MPRLPALCHLSHGGPPRRSSTAPPDCACRCCWIRLKHACPDLSQPPRLRYLNLLARVYGEEKESELNLASALRSESKKSKKSLGESDSRG